MALFVLSLPVSLAAQVVPPTPVEPVIPLSATHELIANSILDGAKQPSWAVAFDPGLPGATGIHTDGAWFVKTRQWIAKPTHDAVATVPDGLHVFSFTSHPDSLVVGIAPPSAQPGY
jgi:hypothetical protein